MLNLCLYMEYPYDPSWGYQSTRGLPLPVLGPQEFMFLIDTLHEAGME
jgi:1,4-alpha-glucan branching enzyme